MERIESEEFRKRVGICKIIDKARESRLRWYGHIVRRGEDSMIRKAHHLNR